MWVDWSLLAYCNAELEGFDLDFSVRNDGEETVMLDALHVEIGSEPDVNFGGTLDIEALPLGPGETMEFRCQNGHFIPARMPFDGGRAEVDMQLRLELHDLGDPEVCLEGASYDLAVLSSLDGCTAPGPVVPCRVY